MNFINGTVNSADGNTISVDLGALGALALPRHTKLGAGQAVTVGIRPEHLRLAGGEFTLPITPNIVEHLGIHTVTYSTLPGGENFIGLFEGDPNVADGKSTNVSFSISQVHLFDQAGLAVY
jgi:multiple sugar transport system ATP-binding protein